MTYRQKTGKNIGKAYAALFLLSRKPRTKREIREALGISAGQVKAYIDCAIDEGLVEEVGRRKECIQGPDSVLYAMVQP